MTSRWTFKDLSTGQVYQFVINPNEGGSLSVEKEVSRVSAIGPNRISTLSEGRSTPGVLEFSGVILSQAHYESFEVWAWKKTLLELTDDLGRVFQGVVSAFSPQRQRRGSNPWFHTYSARFTPVSAMSASGEMLFGKRVTAV
jgi:hypothetical protein